MISRVSRGPLSEWWWTVDRLSFFLVIALICVGVMLSVAASPTVYGGPHAEGTFVFAVKQILFAGFAVAMMVGVSLLSPEDIARLSRVVFALALFGLVVVLFFGKTIYHASRWIEIGGITLQPSEFLKPGFAILVSAILTSRAPMRFSKPVMTLFLLIPAALLLLAEPDVGQTFLILAVWAALLFFSGTSLKWLYAIGGGAVALATASYFLFDHVHHRMHAFLFDSNIGYQTGLSLKAFAHGGLWGAGPGAGTVKYLLPEAHSDYIFAVAGEEFGFLLCLTIALAFCVLAVRTMLRASESRTPFVQLAGAALAVLVALQAFVNMGMAVSLLPPKGMTLPFISYGGSSLFSVALTMGFALALTRRRQQMPAPTPSVNLYQGAPT